MVSCCVRGCRRDSRRDPGPNLKGLKFYSFPRNIQQQKIWVDFCDARKQLNLKTARVCSRHFEKKYHFKRPIDIALGLSCPVFFRNLLEGAVPTLNPPPKDGEVNLLREDEQSIAHIDESEMNPESSDSCSEPSRYIFSNEAVMRLMEANERQADSASEVETEITTETGDEPPSVKKPKIEYSNRRRTTTCPPKKTVTTETPYMAFYTDKSAVNEKAAYCDKLIAQNHEVLETSDASQYIILKRSEWKDMEERLQRHFKKAKEIDDTAEIYAATLAENEELKERLANLADDTTGGAKSLGARLAEFESRNLLLANENRALKRDKEKLEERTKKHAMQLKQYFTTGQLKRMFSEDQRHSRWTTEDLEDALALKSQSIPAYKFLQDKFGFLLPDLSTLRRWVRKKKQMIEDGISNNPRKPPTEHDTAVQNMILLYEQTDDGEGILEEELIEGECIELIVEE